MERYIVVDNACGWPKLTLMSDGTLNLDIHDKPSHGSIDGSAVCYKSFDGGRSFEKYGVSGVGSAETGAFIDKACGCAHNGDYIVVAQNLKQAVTSVFRSSDSGKTFEVTGTIDSGRKQQHNHGAMPFPYGSIVRLPGNSLAMHYWMNSEPDWSKGYADAVHESHVRISRDDGMTWDEDYLIGFGINETALLFYDDMNGIAVGRIDSALPSDETSRRDAGGGSRLYRTSDGGVSWQCEGIVLSQGMIPVHLLLLQNGETLMTYGFRFANQQGTMVSVSNNFGKTWVGSTVLVISGKIDGGYPSSVQLDDGTIVTAYYSDGNMFHTRYHVGVIRWQLSDMTEGRWIGRPATFFCGTDIEYIPDWRIS